MYKVYIDDACVYNPISTQNYIFNIKVNLRSNAAGSVSFKLQKQSEKYDEIEEMRSIVKIYEDKELIFEGRVTSSKIDLWFNKEVEAEGILAYFNDTIFAPLPAAQLTMYKFLVTLLAQHNNQASEHQRFTLDGCSSTAKFTIETTEYKKSWDILSEIVEQFGGFLVLDYSTRKLNYYSSYKAANAQSVELGKNLLDYAKEVDASDLVTAVVPIGKDGLTIKSITDGRNSRNSDIIKSGVAVFSDNAREKYGWIAKVVTYADEESAANLRSYAEAELQLNLNQLREVITIKACDLHVTDASIAALRLNKTIRVKLDVHDYEAVYNLTEMELDLLNPQNTTITLNDLHYKKSLVSSTMAVKRGNSSGVQISVNKPIKPIVNPIIRPGIK